MHSLRISILAVSIALVGTAWAEMSEVAEYDPRAAFTETDLNKDGLVDLGEFHARIVEVFYGADTNKDGYLEVDELGRLPLSEPIDKIDRNGDGKVDLHEFVRIRVHQFLDADGNDDVELSLDEVVTAYEGKGQ